MNTIGPSDEIRCRMARPSVVLPILHLPTTTKRLTFAQLNANAIDCLDVTNDTLRSTRSDGKNDFQFFCSISGRDLPAATCGSGSP